MSGGAAWIAEGTPVPAASDYAGYFPGFFRFSGSCWRSSGARPPQAGEATVGLSPAVPCPIPWSEVLKKERDAQSWRLFPTLSRKAREGFALGRTKLLPVRTGSSAWMVRGFNSPADTPATRMGGPASFIRFRRSVSLTRAQPLSRSGCPYSMSEGPAWQVTRCCFPAY